MVQTTAWVISNNHTERYQPVFFRLIEGNEEQKQNSLLKRDNHFNSTAQNDFQKIPGAPIAYWLSESQVNLFDNKKISQIASTRLGMATADNERFLRFWHEVNFANIGFDFTDRIQAKESGLKWFPYQKGGEYRKWYGNLDYVVNWFDDGREIQNFTDENQERYVHITII